MVSGDPVSTITGISCPLFKWSINRIWSPRPAPLFNDVSAGSGGRIESSASQFGGVAQEHLPVTNWLATRRGRLQHNSQVNRYLTCKVAALGDHHQFCGIGRWVDLFAQA